MSTQDGADLIFITGAPGSKWSAIAHALIYADGVNISDVTAVRAQEGTPLHFGSYFGPGMEYGAGFENLQSMSRDQLYEEFSKPYTEDGGIRLIKSHLFSRSLPYLRSCFPKAKFLLVHRPNKQCLDWWQKSGGFRIRFPDYTWYENDENMSVQIALDNEGISKFAKSSGRKLTRYDSLQPVLDQLGLKYSKSHVNKVKSNEYERHFGYGKKSASEIIEECLGVARLASLSVVSE
jgi:hypothetical protein